MRRLRDCHRRPVTVLLADDSALVRRALREVFASHSDLSVIAEAKTGCEAARLAVSLRPQLVTMDIDMPESDGLSAIETIMSEAPTRIIVVTGMPTYLGLDVSFEAISRGALELLPKPSAWPATDAERERLVAAALELSTVPVVRHVRASHRQRQQRLRARRSGVPECATIPPLVHQRGSPHVAAPAVVVMGASTGGPSALRAVLSELPASFPLPIVLVQHLASLFADGFVQWLGKQTRMSLSEAVAGTRLVPGTVYVAVRGPHILVSSGSRILDSNQPHHTSHRPSVDVLFESAAASMGCRTVGVLLSGMGSDGAQGMKSIAHAGGVTLGQNESSSAVFGMAKAASELGACDHLGSPSQIASSLVAIAERVSPNHA